jgi:hypothetical protein
VFPLDTTMISASARIKMAEGVGLLPTNRKALKINGRFRRYVLQDYRTSVPVGNAKIPVVQV